MGCRSSPVEGCHRAHTSGAFRKVPSLLHGTSHRTRSNTPLELPRRHKTAHRRWHPWCVWHRGGHVHNSVHAHSSLGTNTHSTYKHGTHTAHGTCTCSTYSTHIHGIAGCTSSAPGSLERWERLRRVAGRCHTVHIRHGHGHRHFKTCSDLHPAPPCQLVAADVQGLPLPRTHEVPAAKPAALLHQEAHPSVVRVVCNNVPWGLAP